MKDKSGTTPTKSPPSARVSRLLDEAAEIMALADQAQQLATALRKKGESKLAQAKALMPLPLFAAARQRH